MDEKTKYHRGGFKIKMENKDKTLSEERCYNPDGKFWYYPEVKLAEAVKNFDKDVKSLKYPFNYDTVKVLIEKHFGSFDGR